MDRNREGRRSSSNMAASDGLSRRRQQRTTRDSAEEDGQIMVQETARLRDRGGSKRERDRESLSRNKRSRRGGDKLVQGSNKEEREETTEESIGYEYGYEIEDGEVSRLRPPPRAVKQVPGFKVAADEMIGVSVPRKARSASVKRSHESWVLGNGGFGCEDRRASTSPAASRSFEAASPSSSNVSVIKKTKSSVPQTRLPNVSKSSTSSAQEDIEIEIAEVLFGLKKQSHGPKNEEKVENGLQKIDSMDANGIAYDSKSSPNSNFSQTSIFNQNNASVSDTLIGLASRKQKMDADSVLVHNSLIASPVTDGREDAKMEVSATKLGKPSFYSESCEVSQDMIASKLASGLESQEEAVTQQDSKPAMEESGVPAKEKSVLPEEKSPVSKKLDVDFRDSVLRKSTSTVSKVDRQREEKFEIDLMAPPPMVSSPEWDGFVDLSSNPKPTVQDVEMKMENMVKNKELVESPVEKEGALFEEKVIKRVGEKRGLELDFEKPNHNEQQTLQPKAIVPKVETAAQSGSLPLPIAIPRWQSSNLMPLGYTTSFQTVVPMDGTTRSSKALQPPQFIPQPRPKRCATHHYIACNIRLQQQFTKMNHFWPVAAGSATLCGVKPTNLNAMPSVENMIIRHPSQGSFPVVNLNSAQDKVQAVSNIPDFTRNDRGSESVATLIDTAQKKQLVLHQPPQPAPAGNLMHGPAFIFSLNPQHQASTAAMESQTGPSKSSSSINNELLSGSAVAGVTTISSALPGMTAAVSFSYPNLAANEAPYLTILPNNGYPFPISTPVGNPTFRGGAPAQALSFFNGSFYPSQMLHPSQLQQQQPQPVVQPGHQNASTSSGSSSHKQPQSQQPRVAHVSTNHFLTSTKMQSQQLPKPHIPSHHSRKLDSEMSGESTPIIADTRASHSKKSVHGPNFMVPLQPNFGVMASTNVGGGGNHGEKQQQQKHQLSQEKNLMGGVELVPSQAFAMSFASFNGSKTASNLNFSAMAQNPPILQSFPDMTWQGYQVVSAGQATQKKNHQMSEGKTGGSSTNPDDGKKTTFGRPSTGSGQTLIFDNSARTLSFVPSPFTGHWPSHSITAPTSIPMAAHSSSTSQQQQLVQLQKQHVLQQPMGAAESKAPTSSSLPSPSIDAKFSNNTTIFSQTQAQESTPQNPPRKNSSRTPSTQSPLASLTVSSTVHKNASQQQGRAPQGRSQISFGPSSKSSLPPKGQQISSSNHSPSSGGNTITASKNTNANLSVPAIQSQQCDNSSSGNTQKSSPVCGRNVPSILSTCPSHLSELKY
ncbi:TIC-LIKE PROTEIN [Salix viminalis]|uniref:TIC-LIKE PROTEIN n=1 Tax=Salix viminalis TaxID=40686 RepID=A0A9Q0UTI8_SALVM|nr:TIC-LIKE PROTEIN [Salix viminalis]